MPPAKEELITMTTPSRRVVKGKKPKAPPSSLEIPKPTSSPEAEEEVDVSHVSYALGSPSVERELEQEQVDKWRKERLVGMAAKQKMERDKEVLERRQSSSTPTKGMEHSTSESNIPQEVLEEFSVEPKYPEHKRSGDTISGISDGEPQGKRRKASVDEGYKKDTDSGSVSKIYVLSAVVAAVAIGVAIFRRSRG